MEKLTWFKFVISDWMMGKIQKCPEVTQARFMRLCCLYWNKECMLSYEDAEIEIDDDHLKILLSKKIVIHNQEFITIKFLDEQNDGVVSLSDKRSAAANSRWEKNRILKEIAMQDDANALKKYAIAMQNDAEKIREDKSREEEKRKDDEKAKNQSSSSKIYSIKEFEKVEIGQNEFTLLATRRSGRRLDEIKTLFDQFIIEQKAVNKIAWKDEPDAKTHFHNWIAKKKKIKGSSEFNF